MPFASEAQRRLFHVKADKGEISKKTVKEWEDATKNKDDLPYHVKKKAALFEAMGKHAAAVVVNALGAKGVGKRQVKNDVKDLKDEGGSDGSAQSNLLSGMKTE